MKYEDSGVNIDKANEANRRMSAAVKATWGPRVLSNVGAFGGLFAIPAGYRDPVLVSSMDGVGTKIMVAQMAGVYDTVGQDLVNHCINDILVQGARPMFFLDYVAAGRLEPQMIADIVGGLGKACQENGCALIGGETAEMPGLYQGDDFDLAGTIVGIVERESVIDGSEVEVGDRIFALPSSGLHTNGYSLARSIVFGECGLSVNDTIPEIGQTVAEVMLEVHRSYLPAMEAIMEQTPVRAMAHITGGGVVENLPRVLPEGCAARIDRSACPIPPVFSYLQDKGAVDATEMYRVFNMGMGMLFVAKNDASLPDTVANLPIYHVGEIVEGNRDVTLV